MPILAIIGLGLLLHESVYFCSRGVAHFSDQIAPALALRLCSYTRVSLHMVAVGCAASMLLCSAGAINAEVMVIVLGLLIAAFPRRVPNHLFVAWFFLASLLCVDGFHSNPTLGLTNEGLGILQWLTAMTYIAAVFHKLNRSFLQSRTSCAVLLVSHYFIQRWNIKLRAAPFVTWFIILVPLCIECVCPLAMLSGIGIKWALLLSIILAIAFGALGHCHFSTIMLAGISSFIVVQQNPHVVGICYSIVAGAALCGIIGNTVGYWPKALAITNYVLCGGISGWITYSIFFARISNNSMKVVWSTHPVIVLVLLLVYAFNALSPYIGLKTGFSLAMFSNWHPGATDHLIVRKPLRLLVIRYVTNIRILPGSATSTERELFRSFFPSKESQYAIGYVQEAFRIMRKSGLTDDMAVLCEDNKMSTLVFTRESTPHIRWYEKLSVFPIELPRPGDPFCE